MNLINVINSAQLPVLWLSYLGRLPLCRQPSATAPETSWKFAALPGRGAHTTFPQSSQCLLTESAIQPNGLKGTRNLFLFFKKKLLSQSKQLRLAFHLPKDFVPRNIPLPVEPHDKDAKHAAGIRSAAANIAAACIAWSRLWSGRDILTSLHRQSPRRVWSVWMRPVEHPGLRKEVVPPPPNRQQHRKRGSLVAAIFVQVEYKC